jgi:hypothetical protein
MPLVQDVGRILKRLAPAGWRELLLKVTEGQLDIAATDLKRELTKQLSFIDRKREGFQDFAGEGTRAIEPGWPALSLLYHALASPSVIRNARGKPLKIFPNLADMDVIENYIFSLDGFSAAALKTRAKEMAVIVFACEYRPAKDTVHQKHADLCFSRIGVARSGTTGPLWDAPRRHFQPLVEKNIHAFRVMPARFVVYLAARYKGDHKAFGPMRFQLDDTKRDFWVPVRKLFDGKECIEGLNLQITLKPNHVHEKLRKFHEVLNKRGYDSGWREPDINHPPFVITEGLAQFSKDPHFGPGVLVPIPHTNLVEGASYQGNPLAFRLLKDYKKASKGLLGTLGSSLWILPQKNARLASEFVNVRREILADGREVNLNEVAELDSRVKEGGYSCRHFVDYTADGWIEARVPALASHIRRFVSAYSLITPPSFFPYCNQRELMDWAIKEFPDLLGKGMWAEPPRVLCDRRYAANVTLKGAGFELHDDTVPAVVSMYYSKPPAQRPLSADEILRPSSLPDASAGVFDPGWDSSISHGEDRKSVFLENYGLGSPFLEDAKLCAAFGSFWPAVAPDSTREFQPLKGWPTIVPLTDEEIGMDGGIPWDGVQGPQFVQYQGMKRVLYSEFDHTDYIDNIFKNQLTAFYTARINAYDYKARVHSMALIYWALGIDIAYYLRKYKDHLEALIHIVDAKAVWAVFSFKKIARDHSELKQAQRKTSTQLEPGEVHRYQVYRHGRQLSDKKDPRKRYVEIKEMVTLFIDRVNILMKRGDEPWRVKHIPKGLARLSHPQR